MCKPAQDTQPAFECRATAALLRALGPLVWASQVGAVLAAGLRLGWVALVCWGVVLYFAVRVQLDAGLFELMAQDPAQSPAQLDGWLAQAGLRRRAISPARSLEDRRLGARRLARNFVLAWMVQMGTLAVAFIRGNI